LNIFRKFKRFLIYSLRPKINIDKNSVEDNLSLDRFFRHYNCDKGSSFIDDTRFVRGHDYGPFYEKHFFKLKHKNINILELGVHSGASSASFVKYFTNANKIYCLDINLTKFKYYSKKFKVFGLDISNRAMIDKFLIKNNISKDQKFFDIIVDDCSHRLSDQIKSFFFFFKHLKQNGIYVIEEFRFPNLYPHLNDCKDELKIDEILSSIQSKKIFKSKLVHQEVISEVIKNVKRINTYKGYRKDSDIAFIEKK